MKRAHTSDDEAIEDNTPEEQPATKKAGGIDICELTELEALTARVLANADDKEARSHLERIIHRTFVENGGVPVNAQDILPVKLDDLKPRELVNVIDNMKLHLGRTQKSEFVARCVGFIQNIFKIFSLQKGFAVSEEIYNLISNDAMLRDALVTSFFGRNVSLKPVPVAVVSLLSHGSNLAVAYTENRKQAKLNGQPSGQPDKPSAGPKDTSKDV